MSSKNTVYIDILDNTKGTLQILLHLNRNGKTPILNISKDTGIPRQTCYNALKQLENAGIISFSKEKGFPPKNYCALTKRGFEIGEYISKLNTALGFTIEGYKRQLSVLNYESGAKMSDNQKTLSLLKDVESEYYLNGQWDSAIEYNEQIISICTKTDDLIELCQALRRIGCIHQRRQEFDDALEYFTKSSEVNERIKVQQITTLLNYDIGSVYEKKGDYEKALDYYEQCEDSSKKSRSRLDRARAYLGKGRVLAQMGRYQQSARIIRKSITIFKNVGSAEELPKACTCLGSSMYYIDIDKAIKMHRKCIQFSEQEGNKRMLGYGLSNIAGCCIKIEEYSKAIPYLEKALSIAEMLKDRILTVSIYINFARIYRAKGNDEEARECLKTSLVIAKKYDLPSKIADIYYLYGLIYKEKGQEKRSANYLRSAKRMYRKLHEDDMVKKINKELR